MGIRADVQGGFGGAGATPNLQAVTAAGNSTTLQIISTNSVRIGSATTQILRSATPSLADSWADGTSGTTLTHRREGTTVGGTQLWPDVGGTGVYQISNNGLLLQYLAVKTSAYTVARTDWVVPCNTTGGAFVVNLPITVLPAGFSCVIKVVAGTNSVTIKPLGTVGAHKIDGQNNLVLTWDGTSAEIPSVWLTVDSSFNWWIVASTGIGSSSSSQLLLPPSSIKVADYTVQPTDSIILVDATAGTLNILLPTIATVPVGFTITVKVVIDPVGNGVFVTSVDASKTIDGDLLQYIFATTEGQEQAMTLVMDANSNYYIAWAYGANEDLQNVAENGAQTTRAIRVYSGALSVDHTFGGFVWLDGTFQWTFAIETMNNDRLGKLPDAGGVLQISENGLVAGGVNVTNAAKTANYSIVRGDYVVKCDTTGGAFTVTLDSTLLAGFTIIVKLINDAGINKVTLLPSSGTIDANVSVDMAPAGAGILTTVTAIFDGTDWWITSIIGTVV